MVVGRDREGEKEGGIKNERRRNIETSNFIASISTVWVREGRQEERQGSYSKL